MAGVFIRLSIMQMDRVAQCHNPDERRAGIRRFAYFILYSTSFPKEWLDVTVMLVVFLIRFLAVKYNFVLPDLYSDKDKKGHH